MFAYVSSTCAFEMDSLIELIQQLHVQDLLGVSAVLFRYNMDKERFLKRLSGIPHKTTMKQKKFAKNRNRSKSFLQTLWLMRALAFPSDEQAVLHGITIGADKSVVIALKRLYTECGFEWDGLVLEDPVSHKFVIVCKSSDDVLTKLTSHKNISFQCKFAISNFQKKMNEFQKCESVKTLLTKISQLFKIRMNARDVDQFRQVYGSCTLAREALEKLRTAESAVCNPEGIFVGTIHAGKGREWDNVIIPFVNEGVLPNERATNIAEERRVLYVGMTRAKTKLILTCTNGNGIHPSRFLQDTDIQCRSKIPENAWT